MLRADAIEVPASKAEERDELMADSSLDQLVLSQYDREHVHLRRYLLFIGLDDATAQEIVQETFLRLHSHLNGNGARQNLRAWIYRVAHNLARNEQSSARKKLSSVMDIHAWAEILPSTESSPESQILTKERDVQLKRGIQELSPAQRECLVLRAQGMKYREIATVLGISIATVGENIQRGLEKLRRSL